MSEIFSDEYLRQLSPEQIADLVEFDRITLNQARRAIGIKGGLESVREHTRSTGAGHTKEAGSAHYQAMKIQPIDYIEANELGFHEGNVVKYVTRWRKVDGLKDLEKAEWYIQRLIENAKKVEQT